MAGIYIHIPFCKSRCAYCGFYSTTKLDLRNRYVDALCKEMELRKDYINDACSTIYIGGGTPSQQCYEDISKLFLYIYKVFAITADAEVTMECNPDDVTPEFTEKLRSLPINRISMGAQTFSDYRLKLLRRRHNAEEVVSAVTVLRNAGFNNISLDLMFGFPDETIAEWTSDIDNVLDLNVEHISAYSLMYDEGTPLTKLLEQGKLNAIDEELSLEMYDVLVSRLKSAGYEHYEISNFAKHGYRSRHNGNYWRQVPYIGLGAAAHSFNLTSRQWNVSDINAYIEGAEKGTVPMEREELTTATTYNDIITTALRTCEGIDLEWMKRNLGKSYVDMLMQSSQTYLSRGLLEATGDSIRLTYKGIAISDTIMSDLMIV